MLRVAAPNHAIPRRPPCRRALSRSLSRAGGGLQRAGSNLRSQGLSLRRMGRRLGSLGRDGSLPIASAASLPVDADARSGPAEGGAIANSLSVPVGSNAFQAAVDAALAANGSSSQAAPSSAHGRAADRRGLGSLTAVARLLALGRTRQPAAAPRADPEDGGSWDAAHTYARH